MEALVDLLPLLFIGAYYLLAGRRRAPRKEEARKRARAETEQLAPDRAAVPRRAAPDQATPFQSFLEQLEEAMAEANGQPVADGAPKPEPVTVPAPPPIPTRRPEFSALPGSFDSPSPILHQEHGFGAANPISEEEFEQLPPFTEPARTETPSFDPHGLHTKRQSPTKTAWQRRLADPKAAQDAFVLQTVFGPRGGRRAEHRR